MQRRIFLGASAASLVSLLTACGGGNATSDSLDPVIEPGGHEHINGLASLPDAPPLDRAWLAQPTPGQGFSVRVAFGAQACPGASVEIFDVAGNLIDSGTSDAQGCHASTQVGRRFLMARAQVAGLGTLYGFAINPAGAPAPCIDVNLLPTLLQRLDERQPLTPEGAEYLAKHFLGIDLDAPILDAEGLAPSFDQERLRLHFADSGLSLAAYLDDLVDQMLAALDRGLNAPASTAFRRQLGRRAVPEECSKLPDYDESWSDDWDNPAWALVYELIEKNWPTATKSIVSFILKKVGSVTGYPYIGPIGDFIMNLIPGAPNPHDAALAEIKDQLAVITSSVEAMLVQFKEAEFSRLYDEVRKTFNKVDAIVTDMADTQSFYARNALPTDGNYNNLVVKRCQELFALETSLIEAENMFLGTGSFVNAGVLNRWFAVHREQSSVAVQPLYTAIVQKQYMDLLEFYIAWMNRIYAYLINAYTAYAETTGTPVNKIRMLQLQERVINQIKLVEALRPAYLQSEKLVIDFVNRLAWVGRCNVATDFHAFIPADYGDNRYPRKEVPYLAQMAYEEDNPCRERLIGSPVRDASIREDLVNAFTWRLPTKNDFERSFGARIKARYGKKFNLNTFKWDLNIPASFNLHNDDGEPAHPIIRDNMTTKRVTVHGVTRYYLWLTVYRFYDLGTGSFANHSSFPAIHEYFFPVATLKPEQMDPYLPWKRYEQAQAPKATS